MLFIKNFALLTVAILGLLVTPVVKAICPNGWVGVGYQKVQDCWDGYETIECSESAIIWANDWGQIASGSPTGNACDGDWSDNCSITCDSSGTPTLVQTPGGDFGSCTTDGAGSDDSTSGISSVYNVATWCCSP